jgi:hypothetical protein
MLRLDKIIKPWKESACLNDHINLYGFWNENGLPYQERRSWHGSQYSRRGLRKSGPLGTGVCGQAAGISAQSVWPMVPCLPVPLQIEPPGHTIHNVRRSYCGSRHRSAPEVL